MNRLALALAVSAAAVSATPSLAGTRVHVDVNVGTPVHRHLPAVVVTQPAPVIVHAPAVTYVPAPVVVAPGGYWKEVRVKTWIPERWVVRTNRWGHAERYCEPGHFAYRTERVWVPAAPHHHHHHHHR